MQLSEKAGRLYKLLYTKNFDAQQLRVELASGQYNKLDVNAAAYQYVEESESCVRDSLPNDVDRTEGFGVVISGMESTHMVEALSILFDYGLDPNMILVDPEDGDEYNIMHELYWVDNGYLGAESMTLMMEHGGAPELIVSGDNLFRELTDDVIFWMNEADDRVLYDIEVRCWMVLVGYGATLDGKPPVDPCGKFDLRLFRNFRDFYYGVIHSDRSNDGWEICFFDQRTNWEVARL